MTKFYDSATYEDIPQGAQYAALYADGIYAVPNLRDVIRIPHRRWITVTGENPHCGIADFEHGNSVYNERGRLREWALRRLSLKLVPPVVYVDRADLHLAINEMTGLPRYWWIPTLDNREWTAEELAADIRDNFSEDIPVSEIWANQYTDHGNQWDESNLFIRWYI